MYKLPLYIEISHKIMHSIETGEYPENSPLPSERYLSEKYHVSRSTIRQSLEKLKQEDFVYTVHGNGSFIKPQVFHQPLTKFYSFTDELKNSNILMHNTIIEYGVVTHQQEIYSKFKMPEETVFHKIVRVRSAKEYPLMVETTYLPKNRFFKIDSQILEKHSLYRYLKQKYDFNATRAVEDFHPVIPSSSVRELLKLPAVSPCMLLERYSYEDDILTEYTQSVIRGDKYTFSVELHI